MNNDALMSTYARQPVAFERGEGVWLWDDQGRRYLDALAGIAVCVLGHAHPAVTRAISEQAGKLIHTSNIYSIAAQRELGERLRGISGMDRAFFCNSGAEANEAAIKLARLHGRSKGIAAPHIIVFEGAFHGRTLATLTATGNAKIRAGFDPLMPGFLYLPFDDAAAVEAAAKEHPDIVAILAEPIQGEGGIALPGRGYLSALRDICDRRDWLLMLDEVQTGMGRTGRWFAHQHEGIRPDVMTLAKGLGNGFPVGACLAYGRAAELFTPGSHGSTFGGNPLACRAALAVVNTIETGNLVDRARILGTRLMDGLREKLSDLSGVKAVRGLGLMVGVELDRPCPELVARALADGLLINVTAERVIRLLPPLIATEAEIDQITLQLASLVRAFLSGS
jgi:acetylornithine/N-succinyldiaminopimelate aminotransferase